MRSLYDLLDRYSSTFFQIMSAYTDLGSERWHLNENTQRLWNLAPLVLIVALSLLLPWWARTMIVALMVIPWLFQFWLWLRGV
jgi:hypothetical protein